MVKNPFSLSRAKILTLVHKQPKTITQLQRETGLGRTTIYFHLEELKKRKPPLIIEKKETRKLGQPVYIKTNKANPMMLETIELMENLLKMFKQNKK